VIIKSDVIGTLNIFFLRTIVPFSFLLQPTLSTSILPECSSVMIFFLKAISTCVCGGIVKKEPADAPLSIETTAKPLRTSSYSFISILTPRLSFGIR
jgi:hypothetical protein